MPPDAPAQQRSNERSAASGVTRVAFDQAGSFPALYRDYVAGADAALQFFAHDWRDPLALEEAAAAAAGASRDRGLVADVLGVQNARWGNVGQDVLRNIESLRQPGSAAVVTGQQLGLFGGPMYTIYKALTAVRLARSETERTGREVVPVFWLAGEDHDWEEVRQTSVLRRSTVATIEMPADAARQPVGRRILDDDVARTIGQLAEALPPTAQTPALLEVINACFTPGSTVRDAFARWMAHVFSGTGLILMSVDEARLKRQAAAIFRRELQNPDETLGALLGASRALDEAGYHQQVTPLAGNLFVMEPEGRFKLDPQPEGRAVARGLNRRFTREELMSLVEDRPERLSPNVVLRPLVQDTLLPTMAYVAGPGEASYFAQLRGVYQLFDVPMPVIYPRASATIVSDRVRKVMNRYDLSLADFRTAPELGAERVLERLHARLARAATPIDVESPFSAARAMLDDVVGTVAPVAMSTDQTLGRSAESLRVNLRKQLDRLEKKITTAEKRQQGRIREELQEVMAHIVPLAKPQERVISPLHVLNRYGPDAVHELLELLPLDTSDHLVIDW